MHAINCPKGPALLAKAGVSLSDAQWFYRKQRGGSTVSDTARLESIRRKVLSLVAATAIILTVSLSSCDGQRSRLMTEQYPSYPEGVRWAIDKGNILRGMTEDQVYLALGTPVCKKDVEDEGRTVTVWLYPPIGRNACITSAFRVYFEQGAVTTWDRYTTPTRYTDPVGGVPIY